jgi:hypothetical protein
VEWLRKDQAHRFHSDLEVVLTGKKLGEDQLVIAMKAEDEAQYFRILHFSM